MVNQNLTYTNVVTYEVYYMNQAYTDEDGRPRMVHSSTRSCWQQTKNLTPTVHLMDEIGRKTMVICYRWTNVIGESPRTKGRPWRPDRNHMMEHMDQVWSAKVKIGFRLSYRALKTGSLRTFFEIKELLKFTLVISYPPDCILR